MRALIPLGQLTILAGTIATASGPHAGAHEGQLVHRFDFEGTGTLEWVVQRHSAIATVFGLAAIAVWLLLRRPGGDRRAQRPLAAVLGLLALQGAVGGVQWALELPSEIVWLHVALATGTWLAMLWTVATAGRLEPRGRDRDGHREAPGPRPRLRRSSRLAGRRGILRGRDAQVCVMTSAASSAEPGDHGDGHRSAHDRAHLAREPHGIPLSFRGSPRPLCRFRSSRRSSVHASLTELHRARPYGEMFCLCGRGT